MRTQFQASLTRTAKQYGCELDYVGDVVQSVASEFGPIEIADR